MENEPNLRPLKILVIVMGIMLLCGGAFLLTTLYHGIQEIQAQKKG